MLKESTINMKSNFKCCSVYGLLSYLCFVDTSIPLTKSHISESDKTVL